MTHPLVDPGPPLDPVDPPPLGGVPGPRDEPDRQAETDRRTETSERGTPDGRDGRDGRDEPDDEDAGRVGYGRFARFTPLALGLLIAAALVFIVLDRRSGADGALHRLVGKPAPAIATTTWDGVPFALADHRGSVVVLNFWAEWCAPCQREMPAFQAVATAGGPTVVVGVDIKTDSEERGRDLVRRLGITYPILRDAGGDDPDHGLIERAVGSIDSYPMTIFIRPNGVVDAVRIGDMDRTEIERRIEEARS